MRNIMLFLICINLFLGSCSMESPYQPVLELPPGQVALFSPDDTEIVITQGGSDGRQYAHALTVWDLVSGAQRHETPEQSTFITQADYNFNQQQLMTVGLEEIVTWDTATWEFLSRYDTDTSVCGLSPHPIENLFAYTTCGVGGTGELFIWREEIPSLVLASWDVPISSQVEFSPNGKYLAAEVAENNDVMLRIIDTVSWETVHQRLVKEPILDISWSPDSTQLLLGTNSNAAVWNIVTDEFNEIDSQDSNKSVVFHPNGDLFLIGGENQISIWSLANLELVGTISADNVISIDINTTGDQLVTTHNYATFVWDIAFLLEN